MSENTKLRFDPALGKAGLSPEPAPPDPARLDDAEAQMRRALGLQDDGTRVRAEPERVEPPPRLPDRFGGTVHRRRFVQDGDVPVTVVRREPAGDATAARPTLHAPTSSRLQRAEAALAAETAARDRLERALTEAQAQIRDLQTKLGHAELAKLEAIEAARREREAMSEMRAAAEDQAGILREARDRALAAERALETLQTALAEERAGRKAAERALKAAEADRDAAEALVHTLPVLADAPSDPAERAVKERAIAEATPSVARRRRRAAAEPGPEPEPVKWWLAKSTAGRR